jgi:hypothetical protein
MNRPRTLALAPLLILALAGCASTSDRNAEHASSTEQSAPSAHASDPIVVATPEDDQEFVLGEIYDHGAVPQYMHDAASLNIEQIRAELEAMYEYDRELVTTSYDPEQDLLALETVQAVDRAHADRLKEIVDCIGWPTRELVGLKATQAAYMVIQHAGHDMEFQNQCLEMMVDLVAQGQLPASYIALLTDRIRVFSDQPQVFGTQMKMARNEFGVLVPTPTVPIEDPEHLNSRRSLMGMVPHEHFVEAIQLAYEASVTEPNSAFASVEADSE